MSHRPARPGAPADAPAGREDRLTHLEVLPGPSRRAGAVARLGRPRPGRALAARAGSPRRGGTRSRRPRRPRRGEHVVLSTGTASGKSLAYLLPALTAIQASPRPHAASAARPTLYLSPTKALAQDQLRLRPRPRAAGPGRDHARRRLLARAARLGARPRGVRPHQPGHAAPLPAARARTLVAVLRPAPATSSSTSATTTAASSAPTSRRSLRRLRRVCASYGASPDLRARLGHRRGARGRPPAGSPACRSRAVTDDALGPRARCRWRCGSRRSRRYAGENGAPVRRSATAEAADLLTDLVVEGVRTLAFVRSRRGRRDRGDDRAAGCSPRWPRSCRTGSRPTAAATSPRTAARSSRRCARGELTGLAATNALELGIDVVRPRRGADGRLPRHPGRDVAAGRPGRARRPGRPGGAGRPRRPAGHLPREPPRGAARACRSRPTSSTPTTPTCWGRTCAPRPRSCR